MNVETLKIISLLFAGFALSAALHWLIGVGQRRLAHRFAYSDRPDAGSPSLLRQLLFNWMCNGLRTAVWCLYVVLLFNLLPRSWMGFKDMGVWWQQVRLNLSSLPDKIIPVVIIIVVTIFLMRFASALIRTGFALLERGANNRKETAAHRRLQTLSAIFRGVSQSIILFIGLMILLKQLLVDVTPILASAGVVGIAIGFGAQSLIKDLFSGFLILLEDQFSVGDTVKIGEVSGTVEHLTLRSTRVRALDGALTIIPNGAITTVSNFSKDWSRAVLDVEIAYTEDLDRAMRVMMETAKQLREERPQQIIEEPSMQGVDRLSHNSVTLRLTAKTAANQQTDVARELRRRIKLAFEREGIKTPPT